MILKKKLEERILAFIYIFIYLKRMHFSGLGRGPPFYTCIIHYVMPLPYMKRDFHPITFFAAASMHHLPKREWFSHRHKQPH